MSQTARRDGGRQKQVRESARALGGSTRQSCGGSKLDYLNRQLYEHSSAPGSRSPALNNLCLYDWLDNLAANLGQCGVEYRLATPAGMTYICPDLYRKIYSERSSARICFEICNTIAVSNLRVGCRVCDMTYHLFDSIHGISKMM